MQNAILDTFFLRVFDKGHVPYENVRDVYASSSEGSSLRDLVITMTINIGSKKHLEKWGDELPRAFLVGCLGMAGEDGVVPFSVDVDEWLEEKRSRMCMHYHVYEEESREESDGDDEYQSQDTSEDVVR